MNNEEKCKQEIIKGLLEYRESYTELFNSLPSELQDEVHGVNYENGLGSDEIISFMIAYTKACKKRQSEIERLEQELKKKDQIIEKAEKALNNYAIADDVGAIARQYFKNKDKEWVSEPRAGEENLCTRIKRRS